MGGESTTPILLPAVHNLVFRSPNLAAELLGTSDIGLNCRKYRPGRHPCSPASIKLGALARRWSGLKVPEVVVVPEPKVITYRDLTGALGPHW